MREYLRALLGRRGTLPASPFECWRMGTRNPATCLWEKVGGRVPSITAKEQMPVHTPHSSQFERILRASFALGTHRSHLEQKSRGAIVGGVGERKQGRKRVRERTGITSGLLQPGHKAFAWMETVASPP